MRVIGRMKLTTLVLSWLVAATGGAWASVDQATPGRPVKTVKQCNEELQKNEAALEAAGESASAFFHRCWWHSERGKPTPIAHGETVPPPADGKGEARREVRLEEGPASRRATIRRPTPRVRPPGEPREAAVPRRRRGIEARVPDAETVPEAPREVVTAPALAVSRAPTQVNVNVPVIGSVTVPILPGLETTVRAVVEHPVVPGLVTTSP